MKGGAADFLHTITQVEAKQGNYTGPFWEKTSKNVRQVILCIIVGTPQTGRIPGAASSSASVRVGQLPGESLAARAQGHLATFCSTS